MEIRQQQSRLAMYKHKRPRQASSGNRDSVRFVDMDQIPGDNWPLHLTINRSRTEDYYISSS
ncbi:hypothetical protein J6590_105394 [Homalodisca vitripennis]|nr:hypothetical protein J6590_105394 [Homalodisca vitripennis]